MSLSQKELWIIEAIVSNSYCSNNYRLPHWSESYIKATNDGESCWTDCIDDNGAKHGIPVKGKEISGVLSSLNKKDFVQSDSGREGTARVTILGWEAYQNYMKENYGNV